MPLRTTTGSSTATSPETHGVQRPLATLAPLALPNAETLGQVSDQIAEPVAFVRELLNGLARNPDADRARAAHRELRLRMETFPSDAAVTSAVRPRRASSMSHCSSNVIVKLPFADSASEKQAPSKQTSPFSFRYQPCGFSLDIEPSLPNRLTDNGWRHDQRRRHGHARRERHRATNPIAEDAVLDSTDEVAKPPRRRLNPFTQRTKKRERKPSFRRISHGVQHLKGVLETAPSPETANRVKPKLHFGNASPSSA
jgi:hypothetical protein